MSLPGPISAFLRRWESLGSRCRQHPWGTVSGDDRYRGVHDANRALVFGAVTPSSSEVVEAVHAMRAETSVRFEQIEVVDVEAHAELVGSLTRTYGEPQRFVLMVAGPHAEPVRHPVDVTVEETDPRRAPWERLRMTDVDHIPVDVQREIVARDREVFFAAGRRVFLGFRGGSLAGACSLHAMEAVALVDDVVTLPEHRRRGVASALVATALRAAADGEISDVFLFASEEGAARRIYERLGFRSIAVSAQFHRDL